MILVQEQDFDPALLLSYLSEEDAGIGGVGIFLGLVRDSHQGRRIFSLTLEHYPAMTQKALDEIAAEARYRWPLHRLVIVHRVGRLLPGERIVFVGTSSAHRQDALDACHFLIDWLKTKAPFWKREETPEGDIWVEAKASDEARANLWAPSP